MKKKPEFLLLNPNFSIGTRSLNMPKNFSPENHLQNSIKMSKGAELQNALRKTLKDIGAEDIIDKLIESRKHHINDEVKSLVEFLDSRGMIENENVAPKLSKKSKFSRGLDSL